MKSPECRPAAFAARFPPRPGTSAHGAFCRKRRAAAYARYGMPEDAAASAGHTPLSSCHVMPSLRPTRRPRLDHYASSDLAFICHRKHECSGPRAGSLAEYKSLIPGKGVAPCAWRISETMHSCIGGNGLAPGRNRYAGGNMDIGNLAKIVAGIVAVIVVGGALSCFLEIPLLSRGGCLAVGLFLGDYLPL